MLEVSVCLRPHRKPLIPPPTLCLGRSQDAHRQLQELVESGRVYFLG